MAGRGPEVRVGTALKDCLQRFPGARRLLAMEFGAAQVLCRGAPPQFAVFPADGGSSS